MTVDSVVYIMSDCFFTFMFYPFFFGIVAPYIYTQCFISQMMVFARAIEKIESGRNQTTE